MVELIDLSFESDQLRLLLKGDGLRTIGLLKYNATIWYNMSTTMRSRANKALIALADENASMKDLVHSLEEVPRDLWPKIRTRLRDYLL